MFHPIFVFYWTSPFRNMFHPIFDLGETCYEMGVCCESTLVTIGDTKNYRKRVNSEKYENRVKHFTK